MNSGAVVIGTVPTRRGIGTGEGFMHVSRKELLQITRLCRHASKAPTNASASAANRSAANAPSCCSMPEIMEGVSGNWVGNATDIGSIPVGGGKPG